MLAYRLFKSTDISEDRQQLARATLTELTYDNMKKQLKAIFDNVNGGTSQDITFKTENIYPTRSYTDTRYTDSRSGKHVSRASDRSVSHRYRGRRVFGTRKQNP